MYWGITVVINVDDNSHLGETTADLTLFQDGRDHEIRPHIRTGVIRTMTFSSNPRLAWVADGEALSRGTSNLTLS